MFVDNSWATQYRVREHVCTPDFDIITVSFRTFYLPQEFVQLTVIIIYVPGPNNDTAAECYNDAVTRSADQPVLILGDLNSCDLSGYLPSLQQYVDCSTRLTRTLNCCYEKKYKLQSSIETTPREIRSQRHSSLARIQGCGKESETCHEAGASVLGHM